MERFVDRIAFVLSGLILAAVFMAQVQRVRDGLPYPQHGDEKVMMVGAQRVLTSGHPNPEVYAYPSLPIYIETLGLALGVIAKNGRGPERVSVMNLGRLYGPFYDQPLVASFPRYTWAALGSLTMLVCGLIARELAGPVAMLLTVLCLSFGQSLRGLSTAYVNVDVPMVLFASLTLLHVCRTAKTARLADQVLLAGILCGATLASKYTGFTVLLPCLLSIAFYAQRDPIWRSAGLFASAAIAFVMFCPYFVLELPQFIDGIASENFHYRVRGHAGFDIAAGIPQLLAYRNDALGDYGVGIVLAAGLGAFTLLRREWKFGVMFLALPVSTLCFLSTYKVHFARNGLILLVLIAVLASIGMLTAFEWLTLAIGALTARFRMSRAARYRPLMAAVVLLAALLPTLPFDRAWASYRRDVDSRNRFAQWAEQHLDTDAIVLLPSVLAVQPKCLPGKLRLRVIDLANADETRLAAVNGAYMLRPVWNTWKHRSAKRVATLQAGLSALPPAKVIEHFAGVPTIPAQDKDLSINPEFDLIQFAKP